MSNNHRGFLINRLVVPPDESILSTLIRFEKENCADEGHLLLSYIGAGTSFHGNFASTKNGTSLARISEVTGLDIIRVLAGTIHRFAPILNTVEHKIDEITIKPGVSLPLLAHGLVNTQMTTKRDSQYCPPCLNDAPYHRVQWFPVASSVCLKHHCLLIKRCSQCDEPLSIHSIVASHCVRCNFDLRTAPTESTQADTYGETVQQLIQSWLMGYEPPRMNLKLPCEPPYVLMRVIEGIRMAAQFVGPTWPFLHHPVIKFSIAKLLFILDGTKGIMQLASGFL